MPQLILIRHSQSQPEKDKPARLWNLTAEGERRCAPLAESLRAYQPEIILSSVETKTVQTGQLVARKLNIPFETRPNLHEHERENVPFFDTVAQFRAVVETMFNQPDKLVFGDETADEAHTRFHGAVLACLNEYPGKTIAISTHGTVMTLFASRLTHQPPLPFWQTLKMPAYAVFNLPNLKLEKVVNNM